MKKSVLLLFIVFSLSIYGQRTNDELAAELDAFIQEEIETQSIPGIATCIVKANQIVYKSAFGMANFDTDFLVGLDTEFTLASISKLFVATACAQLWEEGILDLDEDINIYLPFSVKNLNFPDIPITARQLLQHKSSLHDYESDLQLWDAIGDPTIDLPTFCESYFVEGGSIYEASNWGNTAPGLSSYWYSNAGFTLLGYLVEVISEMPFNVYCQEHIMTPLQMHNATWFYADTGTDGIAMPYNHSFNPYGYYSVPEYPAAMLKSNVEELANFLIAYTNNGNFNGFQLLEETTLETVIPNDMTNGLGWWGMDTWYGNSEGNYWSHGGFMNGVRTQLNYYPNDATGLIILTNGEGYYGGIQNQLESYIPLFEVENLGVSESINDFDLKIFPNPIAEHDSLIIQFGKNIKIPLQLEIRDNKGAILSRYNTDKTSLVIDFSDYPSGVYFLKTRTNTRTFTTKVIVQ